MNKLIVKNKFNLLLCGLLFTLMSFLISCQKEESTTQNTKDEISALVQQSTNQIGSTDEIREVRSVFAKALAKAMTNSDFRFYIHEKMEQRFSSDYELLFIAEQNTYIPALGQTLLQVLAANSDNIHDYDYFKNIPNIDPMLSISMPEADNWDVTTWDIGFLPKVAAVTEGDTGCPIYDENANTTQHPVSDDPSEHTIVVSSAETFYLINSNGFGVNGVHIDDNMPSKPSNCTPYVNTLNSSNSYNVDGKVFHLVSHNALIAAYSACPIPTTIDQPIVTSSDDCSICPRRCETEDELLVDFKINNWGVFKNIKNQFNETRFVFHGDWVSVRRDVFSGSTGPNTLKFVSLTQSKSSLLNCSGTCQGKFISANFRLWTDWKEDEIGSPYKIDWAEVDAGETTTSISIPIAAGFLIGGNTTGGTVTGGVTTSVGVTVGVSRTGEKIVLLGNQNVFFCDPLLMPNNTGSITFRCN